jgi:hypothetical protein
LLTLPAEKEPAEETIMRIPGIFTLSALLILGTSTLGFARGDGESAESNVPEVESVDERDTEVRDRTVDYDDDDPLVDRDRTEEDEDDRGMLGEMDEEVRGDGTAQTDEGMFGEMDEEGVLERTERSRQHDQGHELGAIDHEDDDRLFDRGDEFAEFGDRPMDPWAQSVEEFEQRLNELEQTLASLEDRIDEADNAPENAEEILEDLQAQAEQIRADIATASGEARAERERAEQDVRRSIARMESRVESLEASL